VSVHVDTTAHLSSCMRFEKASTSKLSYAAQPLWRMQLIRYEVISG